MNLTELIETLQELEAQLGGDVEVRSANQPQWAFEYSVRGVVAVEAGTEYPNENDPDDILTAEQSVVYLVEGTQLGYLPSEAHRAIRETGLW